MLFCKLVDVRVRWPEDPPLTDEQRAAVLRVFSNLPDEEPVEGEGQGGGGGSAADGTERGTPTPEAAPPPPPLTRQEAARASRHMWDWY